MFTQNIVHKATAPEMGHTETIKAFFMYHDGDAMSMDRADPEKYAQFCLLTDDITDLWRQELIANDFEQLSKGDLGNAWTIIVRLIRLISASNRPAEPNFKRLLDQIINIAPALDKHQRILILEHFAGRSSSQNDGGICLIQTKSALTDLLITAIQTLSDFTCNASDNVSEFGWENIQQRYEEVQKAIQNAFDKFKTV